MIRDPPSSRTIRCRTSQPRRASAGRPVCRMKRTTNRCQRARHVPAGVHPPKPWRRRAIRSMAHCEAKFDWPRDQFLRDRVHWPSERRVKCENGKLKRESQLEFGSLGMGREATSKSSHLLLKAQKFGHPQDQEQDQDKSTAG
jgi:hypothetical protein